MREDIGFAQLIKYIVETAGFFNPKTINDKKKYVLPILYELRKLPFGYFRALVSGAGDKKTAYLRGMGNLCILSGLLSLEFLDNSKLVSNPKDTL